MSVLGNLPYKIRSVAPGQRALWMLDPTSPLDPASPAPPALVDEAHAAVRSADAPSLRMALNKTLVQCQPKLAGQVARAALDKDMSELPGIGPERLHSVAIGGGAGTVLPTVGDLDKLSNELRLAAEMHRIAFPIVTSRPTGRQLEGSSARAYERTGRLADQLTRVARGEWVRLRDLVDQLDFHGLTNVTRALSRLTRFDNGVSPLDVGHGAWLRHHVSATAGLEHQRRLLELDPYNTAARNCACACQVQLGQPRQGLRDVAFSLWLRPDHHTGWTAWKALKEAGYPAHLEFAELIRDTMDGQRAFPTPPQVRTAADRILSVIGYPTLRDVAVVAATEKLLITIGGAR